MFLHVFVYKNMKHNKQRHYVRKWYILYTHVCTLRGIQIEHNDKIINNYYIIQTVRPNYYSNLHQFLHKKKRTPVCQLSALRTKATP